MSLRCLIFTVLFIARVRSQWFLHPSNASAAAAAAAKNLWRRQIVPPFPYAARYVVPWSKKNVYGTPSLANPFAPFDTYQAWQRYASTPLSAVVAMQAKKNAVVAAPPKSTGFQANTNHGAVPKGHVAPKVQQPLPKGSVFNLPNKNVPRGAVALGNRAPDTMGTRNNDKDDETILPRLNIPNQKQLFIPPNYAAAGGQYHVPIVRQFTGPPRMFPAPRMPAPPNGRFAIARGSAGIPRMLSPHMLSAPGTPNMREIRRQYSRLSNSSELKNMAAKVLYSSRNPAVRINILKRLFTPDYAKIVDTMKRTMRLDMRVPQLARKTMPVKPGNATFAIELQALSKPVSQRKIVERPVKRTPFHLPVPPQDAITKKTFLPKPGTYNVNGKTDHQPGVAHATLHRRMLKQVPPWTRVYNVLKMNKDASAHMRDLISHNTPPHAATPAADAARNREVPRNVISRAPIVSQPSRINPASFYRRTDVTSQEPTDKEAVRFFSKLRQSKPDLWGKLFDTNSGSESKGSMPGPHHPTKADIDSLSSFLHEMGMGGFGFKRPEGGSKTDKTEKSAATKTDKASGKSDTGKPGGSAKLKNGTTFHIPIQVHKTGENIEKLGHTKNRAPPASQKAKNVTSSAHVTSSVTSSLDQHARPKGNGKSSLQTDDIRKMGAGKSAANGKNIVSQSLHSHLGNKIGNSSSHLAKHKPKPKFGANTTLDTDLKNDHKLAATPEVKKSEELEIIFRNKTGDFKFASHQQQHNGGAQSSGEWKPTKTKNASPHRNGQMEIILKNNTGEYVLGKTTTHDAASLVESKTARKTKQAITNKAEAHKDNRKDKNLVRKIDTPKSSLLVAASRMSNSSLGNHGGHGNRNAIILIAPRLSKKKMEHLMRRQNARNSSGFFLNHHSKNNNNNKDNKNNNDTSFDHILSKKTIIVISPLLNVKRHNVAKKSNISIPNQTASPTANLTLPSQNQSTVAPGNNSSNASVTQSSAPDGVSDRSSLSQAITNSTVGALNDLSNRILPDVFNMSTAPSISTSISTQAQNNNFTVTSSGNQVIAGPAGNGTGVSDGGPLLPLKNASAVARSNGTSGNPFDEVVGQVFTVDMLQNSSKNTGNVKSGEPAPEQKSDAQNGSGSGVSHGDKGWRGVGTRLSNLPNNESGNMSAKNTEQKVVRTFVDLNETESDTSDPPIALETMPADYHKRSNMTDNSTGVTENYLLNSTTPTKKDEKDTTSGDLMTTAQSLNTTQSTQNTTNTVTEAQNASSSTANTSYIIGNATSKSIVPTSVELSSAKVSKSSEDSESDDGSVGAKNNTTSPSETAIDYMEMATKIPQDLSQKASTNATKSSKVPKVSRKRTKTMLDNSTATTKSSDPPQTSDDVNNLLHLTKPFYIYTHDPQPFADSPQPAHYNATLNKNTTQHATRSKNASQNPLLATNITRHALASPSVDVLSFSDEMNALSTPPFILKSRHSNNQNTGSITNVSVIHPDAQSQNDGGRSKHTKGEQRNISEKKSSSRMRSLSLLSASSTAVTKLTNQSDAAPLFRYLNFTMRKNNETLIDAPFSLRSAVEKITPKHISADAAVATQPAVSFHDDERNSTTEFAEDIMAVTPDASQNSISKSSVIPKPQESSLTRKASNIPDPLVSHEIKPFAFYSVGASDDDGISKAVLTSSEKPTPDVTTQSEAKLDELEAKVKEEVAKVKSTVEEKKDSNKNKNNNKNKSITNNNNGKKDSVETSKKSSKESSDVYTLDDDIDSTSDDDYDVTDLMPQTSSLDFSLPVSQNSFIDATYGRRYAGAYPMMMWVPVTGSYLRRHDGVEYEVLRQVMRQLVLK